MKTIINIAGIIALIMIIMSWENTNNALVDILYLGTGIVVIEISDYYRRQYNNRLKK